MVIQRIIVYTNTESLCEVIFVMHKFPKIVIEFLIRTKRTDRSQSCEAPTSTKLKRVPTPI